MKIDFKSINISKNNFAVLKQTTSKQAPHSTFNASSLNALSNYNRFICFKAKSNEELGIDDKFFKEYINSPLHNCNLRIFNLIKNDKNFYESEGFVKNIRCLFQWHYSDEVTKYILDLMNIVSNNEDLYKNNEFMTMLPQSLAEIYSKTQYLAYRKVIEDKKFYSDSHVLDFLYTKLQFLNENYNYRSFVSLLDDDEILPNELKTIYNFPDMKEKLKTFNRIVGFDSAKKLASNDFTYVANYLALIKADSVDKLTNKQKRESLEQIIKHNADAFIVSDEFLKYFPLLPKNQKEYCSIVSRLAKSIKTVEMFNDKTIQSINTCLFNIFKKITSLTDKKFNDIRLSYDNNRISCSNKNIEKEINYLSSFFPKLKEDNNIADFLITLYNAAKNPEFKKLNKEDKRIILLASIFHNLPTDFEDDFDSLKRLNLDEDEKTKLFTLLKNKNWIEKLFYSFLNTSEDIQDKLYLLSYDFRFENTFDLSLILSTDKIQKADDSYIINMFIKRIKNKIKTFQKNQAFLPVTKFPSADRIAEAITFVNRDGSTNLKGIYKDKDGLIVINYNEVENSVWEKIGFKRGTISRGIKTKGYKEDINTGNIKFFIHGLDTIEQLSNFEAFNLPDSNALLSVSYAERPESKYRFFRPQGIILDVDTINIHAGGKSDSGSGYKKVIEDYIYTIMSDRKFIPSLLNSNNVLEKIKYEDFIKENKNKQFSDIYPVELRNKLIKALATINSSTRIHNREYNEFLITGPKAPMAVYAYSLDEGEKIDNPLYFLNRDWTTLGEDESMMYPPAVTQRTDFLRRYAIEHNIPFVVFGKHKND